MDKIFYYLRNRIKENKRLRKSLKIGKEEKYGKNLSGTPPLSTVYFYSHPLHDAV
jgi:hypothetical protein